MPFTYSCFISYRRNPDGNKFAEYFHTALANQLAHYTPLSVFRDETDLEKGGGRYPNQLSQALCESVCMVMIYTPVYFNKQKTYCAREYKSMEKLEAERVKILRRPVNKTLSLIIPVIYRGSERFPPVIKEQRTSHDLTWINRAESCVGNDNFHIKVLHIAEYIGKCCEEISAIKKDPCRECGKFKLDDVDENSAWLFSMLPSGQGRPF
jgi:hypothetical protein